LHQAVIELDVAKTQVLINEITKQDASLGNMLSIYAKKFDFDYLCRVLENCAG